MLKKSIMMATLVAFGFGYLAGGSWENEDKSFIVTPAMAGECVTVLKSVPISLSGTATTPFRCRYVIKFNKHIEAVWKTAGGNQIEVYFDRI
jgi:hypothetical protein